MAFHRFPLPIEKNHLIANDFIDFDFYLLATPGSNYTPNFFERVADPNREKLGKI